MALIIVVPLVLLFQNVYSLDPDSLKNVSQLISSKGYKVEDYNVVTEDGYVIAMQRIPQGLNSPIRNILPSASKTAVFVLHGILASSAHFVFNFPDQSLGFLLADAGYDVWLGNMRGSTYSSHVNLSQNDDEFWNFSADEIARYDVPAQIDKVLAVTGKKTLQYIGWSEGTLALFALLSEQPEYNEKITLFTALAPIAAIGHLVEPARVLVPFQDPIARVLKIVGGGKIFPETPLFKLLANTVCARRPADIICLAALFLLGGYDAKDLNRTRLPVYLSHYPAGTSVNNLLQLAQNVRCDCFRKFDYGAAKNLKVYGQKTPPSYDVLKTTIPVALYYSQHDWYATPTDVKRVKEQLPDVVEYYEVEDKKFTHFDFAWGYNTVKVLYREVMRVMNDYRTKE